MQKALQSRLLIQICKESHAGCHYHLHAGSGYNGHYSICFHSLNFRFADTEALANGAVAIAQCECRENQVVLLCLWISTLIAAGTERFNSGKVIGFKLGKISGSLSYHLFFRA